jgi:hypothetical protein
MARTAAKVTQASIARAVRAVMQCRARASIEIDKDGTIRIDVKDEPPKAAEREREIVL